MKNEGKCGFADVVQAWIAGGGRTRADADELARWIRADIISRYGESGGTMRQRKAKDLEKRLQACSGYLTDCSADHAKGSFFDDNKELYLEIGCGKGNFIIQKALDNPDKNFIAIEGQETVILRALEKAAQLGAKDPGIQAGKANLLGAGGSFCGAQGGGRYTAGEANDCEAGSVDACRADSVKHYIRAEEAGLPGAKTAGVCEAGSANLCKAESVGICEAESADLCKTNGARLSNLKFMLAFVHRMEEFFAEGQLSGIYLNFSDPWPKARHAKRRLTYRTRLQDYAWALKSGGFVAFKTDNEDLYQFTLAEIAAVGYEITEQTADLHGSGYESRFTTTEYEEKFKAAGKNIKY